MKINFSKLTGAAIILAVIVGFFVPFMANLKPFLPYLLGMLLFLSYVKLEFKVKNFLRKELFYYPFVVWGLFAFGAFFATRFIQSEALSLGFFLIAITPQAIGAGVIVDVIDGDRELVVANTVIYNMLVPFAFAGLLALYFSNTTIEIPVGQILLKVALLVFVPLAVAIVAMQFKKIKGALVKVSAPFNMVFLFFIVSTAVASAWHSGGTTPDIMEIWPVFLMVFALAALLYASGFIFPGAMKIRKSLSVVMGYKNSALTTWLALTIEPRVALPAIMYLVSHHIINSTMILVFGRSKKKNEKVDSAS